MKTIRCFGFFQKNMQTCRKNWKMMKKEGSDIDEKGQNWWKMKQNNIFCIFSEKKYGNMSKKVKMMKIGKILMKRVKIDEK